MRHEAVVNSFYKKFRFFEKSRRWIVFCRDMACRVRVRVFEFRKPLDQQTISDTASHQMCDSFELQRMGHSLFTQQEEGD